jgi:murein DD-endopeptidase MepM/ murein hydrolase activator NlpD
MSREDERGARVKARKPTNAAALPEREPDLNLQNERQGGRTREPSTVRDALSRHKARQAAAFSQETPLSAERLSAAENPRQSADDAPLADTDTGTVFLGDSAADTSRELPKSTHDTLRFDPPERGAAKRAETKPKQKTWQESLRRRLDPAAQADTAPPAAPTAEPPLFTDVTEYHSDVDIPLDAPAEATESISVDSDLPAYAGERLRFDKPGADSDKPQSVSKAKSSRAAPARDSLITSKKPGKLQFSAEETPPPANTKQGKKVAAAQKQFDKANAQAAAAHRKLPKKHSVHLEKSFDPESGKPKRTLRFNGEVKSRQAHIKGSLPLRPVKAAGNTLVGFAHKKLYQVEHENVGTEAAHKVSVTAESGVRSAYRLYKTAPYRRAATTERKAASKSVKLSYQKALAENPKLQSSAISRLAQKRKIKQEYARAVRESKRAGASAKKAAKTSEKAIAKIVSAVKNHPVVFAIIIGIILVAMIISSVIASLSNIASGGVSVMAATSYLASDADIENAELSYTEWETDLQLQIMNAETSHPGYNEYRYDTSEISHNPYELMAYLTARFQGFSFAAIQAELAALFAEQYTLTFTEITEKRYADPNDADDDGDYEPYDWIVLSVKLSARMFSDVIAGRLDSAQRQSFNLLMQMNGNRQYISNPFDFDWLPYVTSYYGWRVHPVSGVKNIHRGVDIGVPVGTEIRSGQEGKVTLAGYSGDYGNVVVIENDSGLVSKYAHCSEVLVSVGQAVNAGDIIAKSGNTGNSTGPHLHLEVIKDGQYLNSLYFAITGDEGITSALPGMPGGVIIPDYPGEPMTDESFAALMEEAQKHLGKPYIYGASGPDSFDCSGFVCYVINHSGVANVGRVGASTLFRTYVTPVAPENVKPGDLIFFTGTYSTPDPCSHVGIYIGNGWMIHAGSPVKYSRVDSAYFIEHFYAYGRLSG